MKKECTVEEARLKAETYCAMSEHCTDDVCRKLDGKSLYSRTIIAPMVGVWVS